MTAPRTMPAIAPAKEIIIPSVMKMLPDQNIAGPQALQYGDILPFVEDQHGKRTDHIEGRDQQDKGKDQEDGPFLRFHDLVDHLLLLEAVLHPEIITHDGLYPVSAILSFSDPVL